MASSTPAGIWSIQLSWERIGLAVISLAASGVLWTILGISTKEDLEAHNDSMKAHPVYLDNDIVRPMPELVKSHEKSFRNLSEQLHDTREALTKVQNAVYDDRAERLADLAADRVKDSTKSRYVWRLVKEKARLNLDTGMPIRHELDRYLE
jgi:hypothetical protein